MDILNFISKVVQAIAWPVGIIVVVLILKGPIIERFRHIKSLNYKGFQVDFGKELESVKQEANTQLPLPENSTIETNEKLKELASLSPRGAVLEAWINVEAALKAAASRHGLIDDKINPFSANHVIFQLEVSGDIGKGVVNMFKKLKHLRNEAVHL